MELGVRNGDIRKVLRPRAQAAYCLAQFVGNFKRSVAPHIAELDATPSQELIACLFEVGRGHGHDVESIHKKWVSTLRLR